MKFLEAIIFKMKLYGVIRRAEQQKEDLVKSMIQFTFIQRRPNTNSIHKKKNLI
jgi:hypothetical protein